eukprot:SAG22_NODE_1209_length_5162_cov_16.551649_1_plen_49_part_00
MQLAGEIANHDELMSNFFAQPDALAYGKSEEQCKVIYQAAGPPSPLLS